LPEAGKLAAGWAPLWQGYRMWLTAAELLLFKASSTVIPAERAGLCPASESRNPVIGAPSVTFDALGLLLGWTAPDGIDVPE
jgi:hypothetical protein